MSFNPNLPANLSVIDAEELRNQFNALKALIDTGVPVGSIVAWNKNFANTPPLPGVWAECNGQAINDLGSPDNGLNVPDLNGAPAFLRGEQECVSRRPRRRRRENEDVLFFPSPPSRPSRDVPPRHDRRNASEVNKRCCPRLVSSVSPHDTVPGRCAPQNSRE